MDTFLGRYKNLIVLAAILFAQIIALAVQVRRPAQAGETRLLRLWAVSAVTPIEKAVVHSQQWVYGAWQNYAYLRGVRRENRELRAQIERMKIEEARLGEDARMARRVQALLAFKEQYVESTVAAQVIGSSGSEQSRVLYIDKGSKDGLKTDMAVITPTGIVGKIVQVYPDSAQVLPINDQFSGVGVALKDSRLQGILKGTPNGATTVQYIMSDEKVVPGEEVITSGGDRIFPKGLPVGKVVAVEPGKDLFLNIRVLPSCRLDGLEEVLVVTNIREKTPDTKDLGPLRASDILAERLPTVPNKPETGAAAGSKPAAAGTAPAGTAVGPAGANPAHPAGTGPATASKPPVGTTAPGAKPSASVPHGPAPGATAATTEPPKPSAATGTRPAGTIAKPLNGATATDTTSPKPKPAAPTTTTGTQPSGDGDNAASAPKQTPKPAQGQAPGENPSQPAPPAGEQPQR